MQLNTTHPKLAVNPEHREFLDQEALQDPLDLLVLKVSKDFPESLVNPVRLVPQAPEVPVAPQENQVKMVTPANLDDPVREAQLVLRVPVASLELLVFLDSKALEDTLAAMDRRELLVPLVARVRMVPMVKMDLQVSMVLVVSMVREVALDPLAQLVPAEVMVAMAQSDLLAQLVQLAPLVSLVPLVPRVK